MSKFSLFYSPDDFSITKKIMGRQSAGAAFMQALADARLQEVWCYTHHLDAARRCAQQIAELGSPKTGVRFIPTDRPEQLADPGLLYRADPMIGLHAWHRAGRSDARSYSICGITHTISSHGPMTAFAEYLTAPVESWDAVICTSRVAKDAIRHVLEAQAEHLAARTGATHFTLPQLPVIPLGVHTRQFLASQDARAEARARLCLEEDEVAVLFAGRLIVHGKAHPVPMYVALEQAAQNRRVVLIQAGRAPNPETLNIYIDEPKRLCPSVRVIVVDGADMGLYRSAWAAADIFTSLSDNIQETFGLTPIEAMAAGLPVVVSDWNGYKETVRDGLDGFRIPTLSLPPGAGQNLADRHDLGIDNFDYYSGYASQFVAVDIEAAAQAYRRLIDDPTLRRRMGAAGALRAREQFEWTIIFRRYQVLWDELSERRRSDPQLTPSRGRRRRPDRPDPFAMFSTYPTHHLGPGMQFRRRQGMDSVQASSRRDLASTTFAKAVLPEQELIELIWVSVRKNWTPYDHIISSTRKYQPEKVSAALAWLSKIGAFDFRPSS